MSESQTPPAPVQIDITLDLSPGGGVTVESYTTPPIHGVWSLTMQVLPRPERDMTLPPFGLDLMDDGYTALITVPKPSEIDEGDWEFHPCLLAVLRAAAVAGVRWVLLSHDGSGERVPWLPTFAD